MPSVRKVNGVKAQIKGSPDGEKSQENLNQNQSRIRELEN